MRHHREDQGREHRIFKNLGHRRKEYMAEGDIFIFSRNLTQVPSILSVFVWTDA